MRFWKRYACWLVLSGAATYADGPQAAYEMLCAGCHGTDLAGGKGTSLLGPLLHGDDTPALARAIIYGFPNTGMPAVGAQLSDAEVNTLVVYLCERRANRIVPGPAIPLDPWQVRQSEHDSYRIEPIVQDGLEVPWAFDWLPDGRILLTERAGRLRIIENGRLLPDPVAGIPEVIERGEGGLMAMRVAPDYAQSGWIYLAFSDPGEPEHAMTKIVRGKLRDHRFVEQQTIFSIPRELYSEGYVLFGSRLEFDQG